jgi:uncharacterized membrane protein
MKELVRCKSCGFVMEKGKLHGKCPACGVPDKMFEPYTERIAPMRRLILSLDIHPVLVHFPQAFTATILLLSLTALPARDALLSRILATIIVLGTVLPFVVLAAACAGLLDAKVRFRRLTTPLLVRKIVLSCLFLLLSLAIFVIVQTNLLLAAPALLCVCAASAGALACGVVLGLLGTSMLNSKFPG